MLKNDTVEIKSAPGSPMESTGFLGCEKMRVAASESED